MNNSNSSIEKSFEDNQKTELQKNQKLPIFINLAKMKDKKVTVILTNGYIICGKLVAYDEASNLIIEKCSDWEYGKRVICLGRCLSLICLGEKSVL